ncbi:hypothetical protein EDC01DRAFT_634833 [Geopyxis carbonaria]|nr:hypothetical protein EDC01DRAFT_634833 [Geopyxis carbonaria]
MPDSSNINPAIQECIHLLKRRFRLRRATKRASFSTLPPELILTVSDHLSTLRDLNSLCQTNRKTHSLLQPLLVLKAAEADLSANNDGEIPARTVLVWAAVHNGRTLVQDLTAKIHILARQPPRSLFSAALLYAVAAPVPDHDVIGLLLNEGADPERVWTADPDRAYIAPWTDITALVFAVALGRHSVVEQLMRVVGPAAGLNDVLPLHLAVWRDDPVMVRTIVAADPRSVERCRDKVTCGPDVGCTNITAVDMAVWYHKKAARQALEQTGVRVKLVAKPAGEDV